MFKKKLAGLPMLTLSGVWLIIVSVIMFVMFVWPGLAGYPSLSGIINAIGAIFVVVTIVGIGMYVVPYYYRKSQGIDISMVFREIPPE